MLNSGSPVLIQLFTSQGCSSCPHADALLEKLNKDKNLNIISLAYHVDYWDRLGWKDPFSKQDFTQLQYNYERHLGHGSVYTPQAVVNGSLQFVGSDEKKMRDAIQFFNAKSYGNKIELDEINRTGNKIEFNYNVLGDLKEKHLMIALVIGQRSTDIKKGENGGITLENTSIVAQQITVNLRSPNGNSSISIPEIVQNNDELSLVAFIQDKNLVITGVSEIELDK